MRLNIPDLEYAINLYLTGNKKKSLEYFFPDSKTDAFSQHHYMYDYQIIFEILTKIGFTKIKRCVFQKGSTPDIKVLDNRPEETLFVEAIK